MALVRDSFQVLSVQIMDRDKNTSTVGFRFSALLDLTDFLAAVPTTLVPALEAIIDGRVKQWSLTQTARDADVPGIDQPDEPSDVERKGVFTGMTANGHPVIMEVPSINNTLVIDGSNLIDRSNVFIQAFEDILTGATLLGTARVVSNRDENVTSIVKAVKKHRGSSKG